ncbi:hypothetical protein [Algoriphagus pacificus]|uniref:hypothetical protein n=1 Tax=Algoriphagus pacificus TaxID=2811234 RepID=UPI001F2C4742|nr:hypothetical protein [Algoriphagus pacificus]
MIWKTSELKNMLAKKVIVSQLAGLMIVENSFLIKSLRLRKVDIVKMDIRKTSCLKKLKLKLPKKEQKKELLEELSKILFCLKNDSLD